MIEDLLLKIRRRIKGTVAASRDLGVTIGEDCRIFGVNFGSEPWLVSIGNRVTVASDVRFITHDGSMWLLVDEKGRRYRFRRVEIGDDVFIGVRSIIMPGVRIGNCSIVAAGSVVTKSVPSGSVVAGVPARIIGSFEQWRAHSLATCPSDADMRGSSRRERIDSIIDPKFSPYLEPRSGLEDVQDR